MYEAPKWIALNRTIPSQTIVCIQKTENSMTRLTDTIIFSDFVHHLMFETNTFQETALQRNTWPGGPLRLSYSVIGTDHTWGSLGATKRVHLVKI
jgi:hypothetical protein